MLSSRPLYLLTLLVLLTPWCSSQDQERLKVVTKPFAPFVIPTDDGWRGFSIDLWKAIALELDVEYEWIEKETVGELLDALREGEAEVAMAGITIDSQRESVVDFSYPFFDSGLHILVRNQGDSSALDTLFHFLTWDLLRLIVGLIVIIFLAANLLWLFERRENPDMFPSSYVRGVWEAFWWSAVTITTVGYGDKSPIGLGGRIVGLIWMFAGIVLFGYFTATVTSHMTIQSISGSINGPEDLPGKRIATARNTSAADWLEEKELQPTLLETIDDAYAALYDGTVDAVVYDAPVLLYYAHHGGAGRARVMGRIFDPQSYGIGLVEWSPLRERINRALLLLRENGTYYDIHRTWFGLKSH